jgi:hypothetical protein
MINLRPKKFDILSGKIINDRMGGLTLEFSESRFRFSICPSNFIFSEKFSKSKIVKTNWFIADETVNNVASLTSFLLAVWAGSKQSDIPIAEAQNLISIILDIEESLIEAEDAEERASVKFSGATRYKYAD